MHRKGKYPEQNNGSAESPDHSASESSDVLALGRVVATPGALAALQNADCSPLELLARHVSGDWGDLNEADRKLNDLAIRTEERVLSAYRLNDESRVWIVTEADRSATTILLPSEY